MELGLNGKVDLVTRASRCIGAATVRNLPARVCIFACWRATA